MSIEQTKTLSDSERKFISEAAKFLENPSFLMKAANLVGMPLEKGLKSLPEKYSKVVHRATEAALRKGLEVVIKTVGPETTVDFEGAENESRRSGYKHSAAAFGVGLVGGFVGALSLPIELPITTGIILRAITHTANEFDMDITNPEVQMECLYILTLGSSKSSSDDEMQSAYWTSRAGFAVLIREAATYLAANSMKTISSQVASGTAPAVVKFIAAVAARFEINVTEKILAEAIPVVGAIGGGVINAGFTDYFNDAARFHFGLKNLERKYGSDAVRAVYLENTRSN